jgi:7-carboxy-7-deazaguanine synthase
MLLEERAGGRFLVDVVLFDTDVTLLQKTSGVAAGSSGGFPIENRTRHAPYSTCGGSIFPSGYNGNVVLTINEIFHSIQGESTRAGRPCVFVRLTACDLRCSWCDTPYAFTEGRKMAIGDVIEHVNGYGCELVEVTGGEPLLQRDVYPLMEQLLASGKTVMIETGGHLTIKDVPPAVIRIVDVKCPGSGESAKICWQNLELLTSQDEVKFVIQDRVDYEFAKDVVARYRLIDRTAAVLFSPVHGVLPAKDLAAWILADGLTVRLQLQAHKYIWDAHTRGV